jgi:hypothetical protein
MSKEALESTVHVFLDPDCADLDDLRYAIHAAQTHPVLVANALFRGLKGRRKTLRQLITYACLRACAMDARWKGWVQTAIDNEVRCERVYSNLPAYAQW